MKTKKPIKENYTFDYTKELADRVEELQPMIIEVIELKKKTHKTLAECAKRVLVNYPDIEVKYVGRTLDPDTGKKFATYQVSKKDRLIITEGDSAASHVKTKHGKTAPILELSGKPINSPKKKPFFVGVVRGVMYVFSDDNGHPKRTVKTLMVFMNEDPATHQNEAEDTLKDAERKLLDEGYVLTEEVALRTATALVGKRLSSLAHEIEYGDCPCHDCIRTGLMQLEAYLKFVRDNSDRHARLINEMDLTEDPEVFPNDKDLEENYTVKDGKLVLKETPEYKGERKTPKVGIIKPGELPKELEEGLLKFIREKENKAKETEAGETK